LLSQHAIEAQSRKGKRMVSSRLWHLHRMPMPISWKRRVGVA